MYQSSNVGNRGSNEISSKGIMVAIVVFIMAILLIIAAFVFIEKVPEGKVAVVYTPSGGASEVLDPGWHLVGLFDKTTEYPTRITIVETKVSVTTSDGKKITMPTRYEFKVDKAKVLSIFKELGSQNIEQIQEGYLYQKLFKASRDIISQYSVLDIYGTKASEASAKVTERMAEGVESLGFIISDVTLGTPEVDAETQAAIDARVKAAQENELKKQELENEKIEAEKKKVIAEGEAEKKLIEAKAEAEANRIISESVTDQLIRMKEAEARLKHGWVTVQGGNAIVDTSK